MDRRETGYAQIARVVYQLRRYDMTSHFCCASERYMQLASAQEHGFGEWGGDRELQRRPGLSVSLHWLTNAWEAGVFGVNNDTHASTILN